MYFKPPQNNHNDFYHPLNQVNEQKSTKARVMFKGSPSDARRDMRVAKETGLYDRMTEKPSGRGRVYEITFKSEGQFRRFMSQFEVDLMEYPLKESRDDFDYLDIEAAMQDAKLEAPKVVKTRRGYQVMVFSRKLKKHIPQGPPHRSKAAAEKDAKMFEDVQIDEASKMGLKKLSQGARTILASAINMSMDGVPGMDSPAANERNLGKFSEGDYDKAIKYLRKSFSKGLLPKGQQYAKEVIKMMEESVELDEEKKKPISTRLGDAFDSGELEDRIKSMSGPARKSFMNLANSLTDFYHSMGDIHQVDGRQLEDKIDGSPPRVRKMFAKLLDEEVTRLKEPHRVQKKKQTRKAKPIKDDVQLDEVTGETRVMAKGDRNHFERITRALGHASANGKIDGYEGAHINEPKGIITLIFDTKAHKARSQRQMVAKMLKTYGLKFDHSIEEGFASDAQRRAAFASGYKAKGKKKKKEEEVEEGLRQAMSGPKETPEQKRKRQEKDNFDLYKKRQGRVAALRGDKSSRQLTPKQQRDYLRRVNLDQIKAMEETIMEGAKFSSAQLDRLKKEYAKISTVDPEKPTYKKLTDMLDKMTDEQLRQIEKAKIKFMSPLASNRLNNRKMKKEGVMEEKGTYSSMGRRGIDKPLMAYIADLEDELKKMGMKYSDKRVNPDDVMKAYNANMSPKDAAKMIKKKG
jgi:hypothetical protein